MKKCGWLIKAGMILTQDQDGKIIQDGAVAVDQGVVKAVGPVRDISAEHEPAEVLDMTGCMVAPGLVNAHTHSPMTIFRGLADDMELMDWLTNYVFPVEQKHTPQSVHLGAMLACAEMAASGTTAFFDMHFMARETARAADASGLRAVVGEAIFGFPNPSYKTTDQALELARSLEESHRGHPRIRTAITPHAVYTTSPELLRQTFALAEELDLPWKIHLAETKSETAECLKEFGQRPLAYLDGLGLLSPRTVLAHAVDLSPQELDLVAAKGVKVAHNPESNMKLASGAAPVAAMLERGITVGLGTDGAASNNNLNMFTEMTSCSLMHKVSALDPTALPARAVLDMATLGSAGCMSWNGLGKLVPGGPADLIAIDLSRPNLQPVYNPVSHAVYACNSGEVVLTMVEGRIVYRDGEFPLFDYPGLLREISDIRKWVLKALG